MLIIVVFVTCHVPQVLCNTFSSCHLGVGTSENVENHVRENVGWILFKTHNVYIFLRNKKMSSKCEFGNYI